MTTALATGDNEERKMKPYISYDESDKCPRCGSIYKIVYSATNDECLNCLVKRNKRLAKINNERGNN